MKTTAASIVFLTFFAWSCQSIHIPERFISTSVNNPWQQQELSGEKNIESISDSLWINLSINDTLQRIDGFGGCFNELGWAALQEIDASEREKIMYDLFDIQEGNKFNICRMPIGANDYALDWYSHNETDSDFEMKQFTVERDTKYLIPYMKAAQEINPNLKIWASPWSPPSWMKKNKHYACRADDRVNDLPEERSFTEELNTLFIMEESYLKAYAHYFSKFLTAYKEAGIPLYAVHVQNEPNSAQNFPSCLWHPDDLPLLSGNILDRNLNRIIPGQKSGSALLNAPILSESIRFYSIPKPGGIFMVLDFNGPEKGRFRKSIANIRSYH